jgi:hypothetical protein
MADLLSRMVDRAKQEIMAAEDREIFSILDSMVLVCTESSHHPGVQTVNRRDCPNEDCWVAEIMES